MKTQTYTSSAEEVPIYVDQMGTIQYWADALNKKVLPVFQLANSSDLPPDTENLLLDFLEWVEGNPDVRVEQISQSPSAVNAIFVINQYLEHLKCDLVGNNGTILNINDTNDTFDIDITDEDGNILETEVYIDEYSADNNVDECLTFSDLVKKIEGGGSSPAEQIVRGSRVIAKSLMADPPFPTPPLPEFKNDGERWNPVIPNSKGNVPPPLPSARDEVQLVFSVGVGKNTPPEYEAYEVTEGAAGNDYRMTG